jgi:hypothetical protein
VLLREDMHAIFGQVLAALGHGDRPAG